MKGIKKRVISGMLCIMMILLTACAGNDKTDGGASTDAGSDGAATNGKGRYLETDSKLPDGAETIYCMRKLENGTIRIVAGNGIFDSKDDGKTFEQSEFRYQVQIAASDGNYLSEAKLDGQGRLFLAYSDGVTVVDTDGSEKQLDIKLPSMEEIGMGGMFQSSEVISSEVSEAGDGTSEAEAGASAAGEPEEQSAADGASEETSDETLQESLQNFLMKIQVTDDNMLLGSDFSNSIYLIDPNTGEIIKTLYKADSENDTSDMVQFTPVGTHLVVLTTAGIDLYNMDTGDLEDPQQAFSSYFSELGEDSSSINQDSRIIVPDTTADALYYGDGSGLYRHTFGAGEMERIINGSLCTMSNPQVYFKSVIQKEDGGFLVLYESEAGHLLKDYTYSKETSAVPENELKVYALRDSQTIRQAISGFQAANPDYYVSLDTGLSGDDSITAEDAIKTLNTNIMSGKGPDVIITDGLPQDAYIEKGVLADLSDVVEAVKKDSALFENVLDANKNSDGIYAVPTRFKLPVLLGDPEQINAVDDLKSLTEEVTALRGENQDLETILGSYTAEELSRFILQLSLHNIWNSDGAIDEAALTQYLDNLKTLYAQNGQIDESDSFSLSVHGQGIYTPGDTAIGSRVMDILLNKQKVSAGTIESLSDLSFMLGVAEQKGMDYKPLNGLSEHVFIPVDTVAVNAKSSEADKAKEFVKYMLSQEAQISSYATGLPVNKDALNKSYEESELGDTMVGISDSETDEQITLKMTLGTKEDLDKFISYLESASVSPGSNEVVTEAIVSAAGQCMINQSDTSETVQEIQKKVNLYLAEQ